jgi:TP901 family phage tail tape measure protein
MPIGTQAAEAHAGKVAGKAFADGEEEGARTAKISYRFKQGAGSVSISEKTDYTAEQVKARAEAEALDKVNLATQKLRNQELLRRIDMMRIEFDLKKKASAEELKAFAAAQSKEGIAEMRARAQGWANIAAEAAKAEKAQRAAAARLFTEGRNLAPDNLTNKGKAIFGAQYAVGKGASESMLPSGAAGLLSLAGDMGQYEKQVKAAGNAHKEATTHTKTHAAAMRDAHSAARGLASGFGAMWLTWGNIAPLLAGASLSHGFMQAMRAGSEFAYQLTFVKALGGETAESVRGIGNAALELSKQGLFGPVELANGLRTLSQAGLSASESMKALPTVIDLATVGEMSMKDAAITLVGVMTAFNLEKTDFSKIGDVFAKAAAVSQTSVEQMTQAMKTASVVGEQYGASMGDTATALTLLAKMNITGTAAGTSLRNMLKELYSPTEKSAKLMKELGVSAQTATGELKPFPDIIFSLKGKLEEFNKASQVKILQGMFGERGAKEAVAMLSLTRTEWDALNRTISESGGFMREVSAELEGTVKGSFKQAINTLQSSLIEAYNSTEGAAGKLAGQLKETFGSAAFKESLEPTNVGEVLKNDEGTEEQGQVPLRRGRPAPYGRRGKGHRGQKGTDGDPPRQSETDREGQKRDQHGSRQEGDKDAGRGRHPFSAAESHPGRPAVAQDRGHAHRHRHQPPGPPSKTKEDRQPSLHHVDHQRGDSRAAAHGPKDVGGAHVPRTDRSNVDSPQGAAHPVSGREGPQGIRQQHPRGGDHALPRLNLRCTGDPANP